jgi:hypothetical protein
MRSAKLTRIRSGNAGTFGEMATDTGRIFKTGEPPWRDNKPGISCIPTGIYRCLWQFSPAHGKCNYRLADVPGREAIEIHAGNFCGDTSMGFASDTCGCILVGMSYAIIKGQSAIADSRRALREFEDAMGFGEFLLKIVDAGA